MSSAKGRVSGAAIQRRTPLTKSGAGRPVLRDFLKRTPENVLSMPSWERLLSQVRATPEEQFAPRESH